MKKTIIVLLLLNSVISYSQEAKPKLRSKFGFGMYFTPAFSYRTLYVNDDYIQWMADEREQLEGKSPAYNLGMYAEYSLGRKFFLSLGLQYSYYAFITDPVAFSTLDYPTANKLRISYNYNYASLPLSIRYNFFAKKKWELFVNIGVTPNLFLYYKQKHFYYEDDSRIASEYRINSIDNHNFTLSVIGGLGVNYKVSKKLSIGLNPVFDHALLSSNDSDIKEYLYSIGVRLNLLFTPY